jgi:ApaG protein
MHNKISDKIYITSKPTFLEEESSPIRDQFVWSYHITIKNMSDVSIKVRRRHWLITESRGIQQKIKGKGVVGQEPVLQPGESFIYTSGALLSSPSGMMEGNYEIECSEGSYFSVPIPAFSLDSPHEKALIH